MSRAARSGRKIAVRLVAASLAPKVEQDTSSQLIDEEDEDFGKDGQGAPEGK